MKMHKNLVFHNINNKILIINNIFYLTLIRVEKYTFLHLDC
jgi:hypothetical protein